MADMLKKARVASWTWWSYLFVIALAIFLSACGQDGYEDRNLEAVSTLLAQSDLLQPGEIESSDYCSSDTCWLGSDGTNTIIEFTTDLAPDLLIEALTRAQDTWTFEDIDCGPESDCEADTVFSGRNSDGAAMRLALNDDGRGQILIDVGAS